MKYLIYARVSERGSDFDGETSIKMQIDYCREYVKFHAGEVYDVRSDEFFTGSDTNRPEFTRTLEELYSGGAEWDVLIVYKLSRMTRSLKDGTAIFAELFKHGKGFVSATENLDYSSPAGRAMLGIMQVFNQFEREQTAENTRNKMITIAAAGGWPVGNAPFGYRRGERKDNRLYPDPRKATIVKDIFSRYLNDANTIHELAKRYGRNPQGILYLLKNPLYTGVIQYAGKIYPGAHEPLIAKTVFDAVQQKMQRRITDGDHTMISRPKKEKYPYVLSGLLRCTCGRFMTPSSGKSSMYHYYRCTDNVTCKGRVNAGKLEEAVIGILQQIHVSDDFRAGAMQGIETICEARRRDIGPEYEMVSKGLLAATADREKLVDLVLNTGLTGKNKVYFNTRLETINNEIETLTARRDLLKDRMSDTGEDFRGDMEKIIDETVTFADALKTISADSPLIRQMLQTYIATIRRINVDEWEISFNLPQGVSTPKNKNGNPFYRITYCVKFNLRSINLRYGLIFQVTINNEVTYEFNSLGWSECTSA